MKDRVDAAKKAAFERYAVRPDSDYIRTLLAASDQIMFSEAAIERAARAMLDAMYDDRSLAVSEGDRLIIRAVVAALREGA